MNDFRKKFIVSLSVLTSIIVLIGFIVFWFILPGKYLNVFPFLLLFFSFVTLVTHFVLMRSLTKSQRAFINTFMLSVMARLLVYLMFFGIYIYLNKENVLVFTIIFLLFYITFTLFEVISVLRYLKKAQPK